jgi:hypothetical protein
MSHLARGPASAGIASQANAPERRRAALALQPNMAEARA